MSRARFAARLAAEANTRFNQDVAEGLELEAGRQKFVEDFVADGIADAEYELACERQAFGETEDTPCIQSADIWGTGEGQYHGMMQ